MGCGEQYQVLCNSFAPFYDGSIARESEQDDGESA